MIDMITDKKYDGGKPFDWGRTSADYGKYRDIYPSEFYSKIVGRGLCLSGQRALDIGTGTGVIPRKMYKYGAKWIGADISREQIAEARRLSSGMDIEYHCCATEELDFPSGSFDVVTACQCFGYFNHEKVAPLLRRLLKGDGRLLIMWMAWLPFDDEIAAASEKLILKYNPLWSGHSERVHPIELPEVYFKHFDLVYREEYPLKVPFTRESWHGRIKACRGIGASLSSEEISEWEREHIAMLNRIAPEKFDVFHYGAIAELKIK